ncbi:MAG: hypothetical protein QW782_01080 [Candidatus Bathyarchaeia archaeon]
MLFIFLLLSHYTNGHLLILNAEQTFSIVYPFLFSNGIAYLDYDMLKAFFVMDVFMNPENFTKLFEQYFIPANIRLIGLAVGWEEHANTTFSDIPYYRWVDDFLSTADKYGVKVFFHFGSWKPSAKVPSWWDDVVKAKPELLTSSKNGTIIMRGNPLIIDSPLVLEQLKEDLKQLYLYYGEHVSWVGIAFGRPGYSFTYVPLNGTLAEYGFDYYTLYKFFTSHYYLQDVDSEGHHYDGTDCKLWETFKETGSLVLLSSGFAQGSSPCDIYGGDRGRAVAISFSTKERLDGFKVSWYGCRAGMPGDLILELHNHSEVSSYFYTEPLEVVKVPASSIREQPAWQLFVNFKSTLKEEGIYSIIFKAEAGDDSNKYQVYFRSWRTDDSACFLTEKGVFEKWSFLGGGILWIKDLENYDKQLYPFQKMGILRNDGSNVDQLFVSPANITFNTIFISVSDRPYDQNTATIKVIQASNGQVVATGILRPYYTKGMYWWIPIPLESEATLKKGEAYIIRLEKMTEGIGWQWHYLITDPPQAGFQGQSRTLLFRLAYIDPIFVNFMRIGPPGRAGPEAGWPGVEYTTWWAQRYEVKKSAPLLRVEINLEKYGDPGDLIVRLREDDGTGLAPADEDIEAIKIPSNEIREGRVWINVTGWNSVLQSGKMYWIVLSTTEAPKGNGFWPWKIEYAYEFLIKRSDDRGKTWVRPHEPAELYIKLVTSEETLTVEPEEIIRDTRIGGSKLIAQSFFIDNNTIVSGIEIFISRSLTDQDGLLTVEIRSDSGFDSPSTMVLTSGSISMVKNRITFKGLQHVDLDYPYLLKAGVKYWLVLKANLKSSIEPIIFAFHDPEISFGGTQYKVKISTDNGLTWSLPGGREADLIFGLVKSPLPPYRFTIEEIAEDIETYHTHAITKGPQGWNAYLNIQTSRIQKELIQWFENYTGRNWFSFDPNPPQIIQEVQGESQLFSILDISNSILKDNIFSPQDMTIVSTFLEFPKTTIIPSMTLNNDTLNYVKTYYETILPLIPTPITLLNIYNLLELKYFIKSNLAGFWNVMRRMIYTGECFGAEKYALNILFVGDQQSIMLAHYLMSVLNVTFLNLSDDYNLNRISNLTSFHVIVWASDRNTAQLVTESAQRRVKDFIKNGGGFVMLSPWPEWADEIVGFSYSDEKITSAPINYVYPDHPILKPYSSIMRDINYGWENKVYPIGIDFTYVIRDMNDQPLLSTSSYGLGRSILCAVPASTLNEMVDTHATIIINAIFYAARKEEVLPILWYEGLTQTASKAGVQYSISGKPGGPLLLWLVNNGHGATFEIHLNASFFCLNPEGWVALDIANWRPVAQGQGNDICVRIQINSMSWLPIYLMNDVRDLHVLYSNAPIETEKTYPNQAVYSIKTYPSETIWLLIRSRKPLQTVIVDNYSLPKTTSSTKFNASTPDEVWFYDSENEFLMLRLKGGGERTIRVILDTSKSIISLLVEHKYLFSIFLIIFTIIFEFLLVRRMRSNRTR